MPADPAPAWRPLGYDGPHYYVLSAAKQQMAGYTAAQLMTAAGCMDIVGDRQYWADYYPDRKRVDWQAAGADIMSRCVAAGLFDPTRVRGRGVWLDRDRVVIHLGGTPPAPAGSDYMYQARPVLPVTATDGPVGAVLSACARIPWVHPMSAELLAGWIALAPVCGAVRVPAVRVEGPCAGAALDIARAALGALCVTGNPGQDARPLITDAWLRSAGACCVLSSARMADAVVLATAEGSVGPWKMPADMPGRLLARQVAGLDAVRQNIGTLGPLMAGAWSLYSSDVMEAAMAAGFLGRYDSAG